MGLPAPTREPRCLVTGASAGLGREIARALARRGRGVVLVARREERLRELADELQRVHGVHAEAAPCDLEDADARAGLMEGRELDILVNDAGFAPPGRVDEIGPQTQIRLARLNVEAMLDLCARATPGMVTRGAGGVLNLASTAAFAPTPNQASYGASKAFVLAFTDAIGAELHSRGVHVTALCPGPVPTEIFEASNVGETHPVDRVPKLFWREAPELAEAGVNGLEANNARAFVGLPNQVLALAGQYAPRTRTVLSLLSKGFTEPDRPNAARR